MQDQKFCNNCGFDLSKIGETQQTVLTKRTQSHQQEHSPSPALLVPPEAWWRNLNTTQIVILVSGGSLTLGMLIWQGFTAGIDRYAIIFTIVMFMLITVLVAWKEKKWGWGWYVLLGVTYNGMGKQFTEYGLWNALLIVFGIVAALLIYFTLRSKYLRGMKVLWQRSLCSGISASVGALFGTTLVATFIPTQNQRVAEIIHAERLSLRANIAHFTEQDTALWARFIVEPSTTDDYETNFAIVQTAIPLYRHKDSILVTAMRRIQLGMRYIYEESVPDDWSLTYTPDDFQKIVQSTENIARSDDLMLSNLSLYYNSLLSADGRHEQFFQAYERSLNQLNAASQQYQALFDQFFGYDSTNNSNHDKEKSVQ